MNTLITRARDLAVVAHGDQKYGESPYLAHLEAVVSILRRFHYTDDTTIAAGYLHDAIEDTDLTAEEMLRVGIPDAVVLMVQFCTDEDGPNRRTRKQLTYARMARDIYNYQTTTGYNWVPDSIRVKVADRLANVSAARGEGKTSLTEMYRREHAEFFRTLHVREGLCNPLMWDEIRRNLF